MNDLIVKNKELSALYGADIQSGLEDADASANLPSIKITSSMSKENILADGKKSAIGMLYHTELKKDFAEIDANICYVGKFMLPDFNDKTKLKQNYILGAVMADNTPFLMFVKGYSLQPIWGFIKDVSAVINRYKVPMYALTTKVSVGTRPHPKFKSVDVFNFQILSDGDMPKVEMDLARAQSLSALITKFKEAAKAAANSEEVVDEYTNQANGASSGNPVQAQDDDEIPFN